jgi:hypothetical protein
MLKRKMRLRMDELKPKKVSQLREIASCLQVNIEDCIEKDEIIERLLASGRIEVIEGAPTIVKTRDEFEAMGVGELRRLLLSFGLSDQGALEKSEFRLRLLDSGRIELLDDFFYVASSESSSNPYWNRNFSLASVSHDRSYGNVARNVARSEESKTSSGLSSNFFDNEKEEYEKKHYSRRKQTFNNFNALGMGGSSENSLDTMDTSCKNYNGYECQPLFVESFTKTEEKVEEKVPGRVMENTSYSYIASPASTTRTAKGTVMGERELRAMSVTELKALSLSLAVNLTNCLYKDDIVDRLVASGKIQAATNTATTSSCCRPLCCAWTSFFCCCRVG